MRTLHFFTVIFLLSVAQLVYAQEEEITGAPTRRTMSSSAQDITLNSQHIIDLQLLGLKYQYETPIGRDVLFMASGGVLASWALIELSGMTSKSSYLTLYWNLMLNAGIRWIYNREKRLSMGKSIGLNSGNFLDISVLYTNNLSQLNLSIDNTSVKVTPPDVIAIPILWGLRRDLGRSFYFDFSLGLAPAFAINTEQNSYVTWSSFRAAPLVNIGFGYVLSSKKP